MRSSAWKGATALSLGVLALSLVGSAGVAAAKRGKGKGGKTGPPFQAATYFPLQAGEVRQYRLKVAGASVTITRETGQPEEINGVPSLAQSDIYNGKVQSRAYVALDQSTGLRYVGTDDGEPLVTRRYTPALEVPNGLAVKQKRQQTVQVQSSDPRITKASYTVQYLGAKTETVPAGTFQNCIQIRTTTVFQDDRGKKLRTVKRTLSLAPNVGLVKFVVPEGTGELVSIAAQ